MSKTAIRELARALVSNHIHCSLLPIQEELKKDKSDLHPDKDVAFERILKRKPARLDSSFRRVIAVTGAGASYEAGMPLADKAIEIINTKLQSSVPPVSKFIHAGEIERLQRVYRLKPDQLETVLLALSRTTVGEKWARSQICEIYSSDPRPILGYEILAHLLKHRFLDAVINFNFDELLDRSVRDELEDYEYSNILSDGDCPHPELNLDALRRPIYIKPHGTVSHPATLRFTRSDYYRLPSPIYKLMRQLLLQRPVDILVIGFKMRSLEFQLILNDLKPGSRVYYLDPEKPQVELDSSCAQRHIKISRDYDSVSRGMLDIWNVVSSQFRRDFAPRSIDRHVSLCTVFKKRRGQASNSFLPGYLLDRTVVELFLEIARGRGTVTMDSLIKSRCGIYFDLYRSTVSRKDETSLKVLCEKVGLKQIGYGGSVWSLNSARSSGEYRASPTDIQDAFRRIATHRSSDLLSNRFSQLIRTSRKIAPAIRETILRLYASEDSEIRIARRSEYTSIFLHPLPIRTTTALRYLTYMILQQSDWRWLIVSSEFGQWLRDLPRSIVRAIKDPALDRQIRLVVADGELQNSLNKKFPSQIQIRTMSEWTNNRHVTVLLDEGQKPIRAIYFRREFKVADVSPTLLTHESDVSLAKEVFCGYWATYNRTRPPNLPLDEIRGLRF